MTRAKGIDVSHWKPIEDYGKVRSAGISFVGAKATEGRKYVDPTLRTHRDQLRNQPFALLVYYHFARSGSPMEQAERFMDAVGPLRDHERLALDLEVLPTPEDPLQSIEWVDDFYAVLMKEYPDRRHLIYTSKRIWRMMESPEWARAEAVDLWAPRYNGVGAEPALPKPWLTSGWTIWQYSDGSFPPSVIPGVGKVDTNYFRGTDAELVEYAKLLPPLGIS